MSFNNKYDVLRLRFQLPNLKHKSRPFWFWNKDAVDMSEEQIVEIMTKSVEKSCFAGFCIVPAKIKDYLTDEYFEKYKVALETAKKLGVKMCIYDENGFPSGAANGLFGTLYPTSTVKRLDILQWDVKGESHFSKTFNLNGTLMAAVLMNVDTKERFNIQEYIYMEEKNIIEMDIPKGSYRIMLFVCVIDGSPIVDYLNSECVDQFIKLSYEPYYERFGEYFGNTVDSFFYDEPAMWGFEGEWIPGGRIVKEGRMWTEEFNAAYIKIYGESPILYYPALWYDIGEETKIARYRLMNTRAQMFADNYIYRTSQWCEAHGIKLTGHMWEETFVNPTGAMGDLMKIFEHQQIPGIDCIANYGFVSKAIKIVTSAAFNYDLPIVMSETFGAMKENEELKVIFYKEIMDQYAKGVNFIVPHAIWYTNIAGISPEISYRSPYARTIPILNKYIARLNIMLQGGRHHADVAMLYPIADLQSAFSFAVAGDQCVPEYSNYMDISEMLSLVSRRDFTYLHPDILEKSCSIDKSTKTLRLDNKINYEEYKVIIIPAMEIIHLSSLRVIRDFYQAGGKLIFIGKLPAQVIEKGTKDSADSLIKDIFGEDYFNISSNFICKHESGGVACFLQELTAKELDNYLNKLVPVFDVTIEGVKELTGGALSYIHKTIEDREVYFIANSSDQNINATVTLRGRIIPELWNPHNGEGVDCNYKIINVSENTEVTQVILKLKPTRSIFIVEKKE